MVHRLLKEYMFLPEMSEIFLLAWWQVSQGYPIASQCLDSAHCSKEAMIRGQVLRFSYQIGLI